MSNPEDLTVGPSAVTGSGWLSSSDAISHGRFAPGTMLAGRYRIIGLLGKGGMGEVYRADDLKLGQPVALKFLPPELSRDPARLARFHAEVRLTRQISHPNVCRVYDVDEVDGDTFLSMEYVDGEDLASLLRRIGRLPEDKALEIARQLCAGLAAAHDRHVLHRDLKPANVMIDGRGSVRVMDFGLAVVAGTTNVERAGTPAYMAPEQLAGHEVSVRSDVYALGLVLFELFTGRRALNASSLAELLRLHESDELTRPTEIVAGLDPAVERSILRCLERDPQRRPASALAVAASLPGGDPLAAAIAAGETPSPAMVAAAGREHALPARLAAGALLALALMLVLLPYVMDRALLLNAIAPPKSTDVLIDRADAIRASVGYNEPIADRYYDFTVDRGYLHYIARTDQSHERWNRLRRERSAPIVFWYRSSPDNLVRYSAGRAPTLSDPPSDTAGMTSIMLDTQGRLLEFRAVPPSRDAGTELPAPFDWTRLFGAADLPFAAFRSVTPQLVPSTFADTRAAWEGPFGADEAITVRVEAATYRGRPVFFRVAGPWADSNSLEDEADDPRGRSTAGAAITLVVTAAVLGLIGGAAWLARQHLRRGRGDRRGADRLALTMVGLGAAAWVIGAHHYGDVADEANAFLSYVALSGFTAATVWLLYLALEPLVRKWQPRLLVGWTRMMSGGIHDPEVGRDILTGVVAGVFVVVLRAARPFVPLLVGQPMAEPLMTSTPWVGMRFTVAGLISILPGAMSLAMLSLFAFVVTRMIVRHTSVAIAASYVVFLAIIVAQVRPETGGALQLILAAPALATMLLVIVRFGLLATVVTFYVWTVLEVVPLTTDPSLRHFATSTAIVAAVFGLGVLGAYAARAGQPLLSSARD